MVAKSKTPKAEKVAHDADLFPALPGQPQVVNLRKIPPGWETDPSFVYIGRSGHGMIGVWGNPIRADQPCRECGKLHKTRDTIPCYGRFLNGVLLTQGDVFRSNVITLTGKSLVCFCAPAPCHGHELVRVWRRLAIECPDEMHIALRASGLAG